MDCLKGKKLLLLGDSIMFGSGNGGFGVGEYLERDFGVKLYKYCVGGARVGYCEGKDWVVAQVRRALSDGVKADLIVFDGFTNDCNIGEGASECDVPLGEVSETAADINSVSEGDTFSACFQSVVFALKKYFSEAKSLFVRPHKMGRRDAVKQAEYGSRAVEICKKAGVSVCDLYAYSGLDTFNAEDRDRYTADTYGWGRGDCTHPNALGYEQKYMPLIKEAILKL